MKWSFFCRLQYFMKIWISRSNKPHRISSSVHKSKWRYVMACMQLEPAAYDASCWSAAVTDLYFNANVICRSWSRKYSCVHRRWYKTSRGHSDRERGLGDASIGGSARNATCASSNERNGSLKHHEMALTSWWFYFLFFSFFDERGCVLCIFGFAG